MEKGAKKKTSTKKETVVKNVISNDEKNEINKKTIVETQELENAKEVETAIVEVNTKEEEDKKRRGLILLILLFLCVFGISITYGNGIFESIKENILETNIITKPKITEGSKEWVKEALISIEEDSKSKKKIDYYEYCVIDEEDSDKCEWKRTDTKNVLITHTGHHYVYIRAVDEEGKRGKEAETEVYIDNNAPSVIDFEAIDINKNSIKVRVDAKDNESGIEKYLYSLDGNNYVEGSKEYTFKNLEAGKTYRLYVKTVDKLGNEKIVSILVTTLTEEQQQAKDINNKEEVITDEEGNVIVNPNNNENNNQPDEQNGNPEENFDIPQIDLDDLPLSIEYQDEYVLPSHYDFGNDTGTVECKANGVVVISTKDLLPGNYSINCKAISSHEKEAEVSKDIEVKPVEGDDELLEGWIRLNLYYPENSTNWEWRLDGENGIRTGYDGEGWTPYTGPILVKIEDIQNIFIRYDLNGETYIITPNGKLVVDIEPDYYEVAVGKVTNVRINYDKTATVKKYRVNGGPWEVYNGPFEVGPGTKIEALAEKEENVYDNHGNQVGVKRISSNDAVYISVYQGPAAGEPGSTPSGGKPWKWCEHYDCSSWGNPDPESTEIPQSTPSTPTQPSTYLEGPIISSDPNTGTVESTMVTITPQENARTIYYSVGYGKYKEYTEPFVVTNNTTIRAYYVRESDGKKSAVSYYDVSNIKQRNLPYIKITSDPGNYLSVDVNSVTVTITGSDYDGNIEYSYDGEIYQAYTGPLTITESSTIYARATNQYGTTVESKTIRTITPAVPKDTLDVLITADPSKDEVVGLIASTKVTINYDSRATKKYYKVGYFSSYREYTGPFDMTTNDTIYAYCTSDNGGGSAELSINYLTTGIASPKITMEPTDATQVVKVEIEFAPTATVTRYKIDNGDYIDYTGPIYLTDNCTITAMNRDVLGNEATSSKKIKNITIPPTIIDKGGYYIIRLNYPDVSEESSREYKWKENGSWKTYDPQGILLIKEGINLPDLGGGYQVEDEKGNTLVFTNHYYQLDCPLSEIYENLFMRWDNEKPIAPTIYLDTEESTREVTVSVNYPSTIVKKYYKTVTAEGIDSGWKEYTGPFKVNKNNTTVYAKGMNRIEIESRLATKKIKNIDENAPTITVIGKYTSLDEPKQKVPVTVKATDDVELDMIKWAKGNQTVDYFLTGGNLIGNNTQVMADENGYYTFYAVDKVGNAIVEVITVENVDTNAPVLNIIDRTQSFGIEAQVEIEYEDSDVKQYSIGNNTNYQNYTGIITIKSEDVYQLANPDGSLTIYAKGKDKAGNITEISENIYTLDLDMPDAPAINASVGYPTLTEYGVTYDDILTVTFAQRNDITNYIDIGNGEGWKVYTGVEHVSSGVVKAKSVKNSTGLETPVVTKNIDMPKDVLAPEGYDGSEATTATFKTTVRFNISPELWGRGIIYLSNSGTIGGDYSRSTSFQPYTASNEKNGSATSCSKAECVYVVPQNTKYITLTSSRSYVITVKEVKIDTAPTFDSKLVYPKITEYGVENGYYNITLKYFQTSTSKLYQIVTTGNDIDETKWKTYQNKPIRLEIGETIYAKSIDKNGISSIVSHYDAVLPADVLSKEGYDELENTTATFKPTVRFNVSSELWDRGIIYTSDSGTVGGDYSRSTSFQAYNSSDEKNGAAVSCSKAECVYIVPQNTEYIILTSYRNYVITVKEVKIDTAPTYDSNYVYPKINAYDVDDGYYNVSLKYFQTSTSKLYQIVPTGDAVDETKWKTYQNKPMRVEIGETVYAKSIDRNGNSSIISNFDAVLPTDLLAKEAYDTDENTTATFKTNVRFDVSSELWDRNIMYTSNSGTVGGNYSRVTSFQAYNSSDETIDAAVVCSKAECTYKVPQDTKYIILTSGHSYVVTVKEIRADLIPIINYLSSSDSMYPRLTSTGFEKGYDTVEIDYFPNSSKKEYKIVSKGQTEANVEWVDYEGSIKVRTNDTLYARSFDKNNLVSSSVSYAVALPEDALPTEAYDENTATYLSMPKPATRRIDVDPGIWGNRFLLTGSTGYSGGYNIHFYDANDDQIDTFTFANSQQLNDSQVDIPSNTKYIIFEKTGTMYEFVIREVAIDNIPVLTVEEIYPLLTLDTVKQHVQKVSIEYYKTSAIREYQIVDSGATLQDDKWVAFEDKDIIIQIGQTIYARGIALGGKATKNASHKAALPADSLGPNAYDGKTNTYVSLEKVANRKIEVDPAIWGGTMLLTGSTGYNGGYTIYMYDDAGNELDAITFGNSKTLTNSEVHIPYNTKTIVFDKTGGMYEFVIREIKPDISPILNVKLPYSVLTRYGIVDGVCTVNIDYVNDAVTKMYKIDDGDWTTYNGENIQLEEGQTIYARGVLSNGDYTPAKDYTNPNNVGLPIAVYDRDETTNVAGKPLIHFDIHSSLIGEELSYKTTYGDISFFDSNDTLIEKTDSPNTANIWFTVTIPQNAAYAVIDNYTSNFTLYEIAAPGGDAITLSPTTFNYPRITATGITGLQYKITLVPNIGVSNLKYKIDDGAWINYNNTEIPLSENQVLYAKGVDNYGISTPIYSATLPAGIINNSPFDGDDTTSFSYLDYVTRSRVATFKVADIDPSAIGKTIRIKASDKYYSVSGKGYSFNYTDQDGNVLSTFYTLANNNGSVDQEFVIPSDVNSIWISEQGYQGPLELYTVALVNPSLGAHSSNIDDLLGSASVGEITRQTIVNAPKITLNNTDLSESKIVSIKYLEGKIGEYSLDLGNTWVEYTGEIEVIENTIILARTKDENGNIISSSSMSITKIKKEEPQEDNTPPVDNPIVDEPVVVPSEPNDPESDNNTSEEGDTNE